MMNIIEGVVSLVAGVYCCLIWAKIINSKIKLFNLFPGLVKIAGPFLIVFGISLILNKGTGGI